MNTTLTYKGYAASLEFDARDDIFVGRVIGVADSITFHGKTDAELRLAFHAALDHYLADCKAAGRAPDEPVKAVRT